VVLRGVGLIDTDGVNAESGKKGDISLKSGGISERVCGGLVVNSNDIELVSSNRVKEVLSLDNKRVDSGRGRNHSCENERSDLHLFVKRVRIDVRKCCC